MIITFPKQPDYRVVVDDMNHTLQHLYVVPEVNVKTGKPNKEPGEKWIMVGYYPNVGQCASSVIKNATMESDEVKTFEEYQQWCEDFAKRLDTISYDNGG